MSEAKEQLIKSEEYYLKILKLSYDQAIIKIETINGKPDFNYFTEGSFNLFKSDPSRKRINFTAGYRKRRKEGFQIHHILENKFENLSSSKKIREKQYPFDTQLKENLVYVDITEHAILHTLIAKKTKGDLGISASEALIGQIPENDNVKCAMKDILCPLKNPQKESKF